MGTQKNSLIEMVLLSTHDTFLVEKDEIEFFSYLGVCFFSRILSLALLNLNIMFF